MGLAVDKSSCQEGSSFLANFADSKILKGALISLSDDNDSISPPARSA